VELELLSRSDAQAIDSRLTKAFNLEKDLNQNGVLRKHYFCKSHTKRDNATQVTAIIFENTTKAVTYETSDTVAFKRIITDITKNGYHSTH
jgi:hypothetical protein